MHLLQWLVSSLFIVTPREQGPRIKPLLNDNYGAIDECVTAGYEYKNSL